MRADYGTSADPVKPPTPDLPAAWIQRQARFFVEKRAEFPLETTAGYGCVELRRSEAPPRATPADDVR